MRAGTLDLDLMKGPPGDPRNDITIETFDTTSEVNEQVLKHGKKLMYTSHLQAYGEDVQVNFFFRTTVSYANMFWPIWQKGVVSAGNFSTKTYKTDLISSNFP